MPSTAVPYRLPVYAREEEGRRSSVDSYASGQFNVDGDSGESSRINSPLNSPIRAASPDNSGANITERNGGADRNIGNGGADRNGRPTSPQSGIRTNEIHVNSPRNSNVRGRQQQANNAEMRNRNQARPAPQENPYRRTRPESHRRQHQRGSGQQQQQQRGEENAENSVWLTVLVGAFLIGAFLFFPAARRVFV